MPVWNPAPGAQLLALAIEADLPELLLQRVALVRGIVDLLALKIDVVDLAHFKVAAGELALRVWPWSTPGLCLSKE